MRQHVADGERRQVGRRDDRQVDAAAQQGDHHCERQHAELGELKGHRLQRAEAEEGVLERLSEADDQGDQQQDQIIDGLVPPRHEESEQPAGLVAHCAALACLPSRPL